MATTTDDKPEQKKLRQKERLPEVLNDSEQERLQAAAVGRRNQALVAVMLDTGLRVSEICSLKMREVDFSAGRLKVINGKGGKDRIVGLSDAAIGKIKRYLAKRGDISPNLRLFANRDGSPLTRHGLYQIIRRMAKRAGITKQIHPHTLRHSFGTDFYRQTKDLELLRQALGHSNIKTTVLYVKLCADEVVEAMQNFRTNQTSSSP